MHLTKLPSDHVSGYQPQVKRAPAPEQGAEFARALGVDRVVVGRELSASEIADVRAKTGAEVETFVHGALCVSYRSADVWSLLSRAL